MGRTVGAKLLDTNVLVRFLVRDNESHYQQAQQWFREAEKGEIKIVVVSLVVAEACFVLESFYKKSRKDISEAMTVFLSQRWLHIPERTMLLTLWEGYNTGLHFVDSFLSAWARDTDASIMSFDKKLLKRTTN